ncbi:hypothetical protein ACP4OV_019171 [Aristida adscensionis]
MALSRQSAALLLAVLAAAAAPPASADAPCGRKILVQNLCDHDITLTLRPRGNPGPLFPGGAHEHTVARRTHAEFPVCTYSGELAVAGAPPAEFHFGGDGAWFRAPNNPDAGNLPVSITPHTAHGGLAGGCPAVGCRRERRCFDHAEPGHNCANVDEIKIIYCQP